MSACLVTVQLVGRGAFHSSNFFFIWPYVMVVAHSTLYFTVLNDTTPVTMYAIALITHRKLLHLFSQIQ